MNYVIGCGGVGSWLVPKLAKIENSICLIDGDKLEEKNMDRQLFDEAQIGKFKAAALASKYKDYDQSIDFILEFFTADNETAAGMTPNDTLFVCVDNHAARKAALEVCDRARCRCVIGANEYTDAEAYWYEPKWRGTKDDPRVFYPSILTDRSGDPLGPPGCTGQAQEESPQLALANDWASSLMLQLFWFHTREREGLRDCPTSWPVHHKVNRFQFQTTFLGDRK